MNKKYYNPYFAGFLLGLVIIISVILSGQTLGTSGAFERVLAFLLKKFTPHYVAQSKFYSNFFLGGANPLKAWVVYEVLGLLVGGFLSGLFAGRLKFTMERGAQISFKRRSLFALIGGIFFGLGARIAHGCTSGAVLSGMALLSLSGFITGGALFGTAFLLAYFFRKNWI